MKKISFIIALFVVLIVSTSGTHATLYNRGTDINGNRLIYDSDLNITWYDYSKSADTWQNQMNWANGLSVTFGSNTYTDWRLSSALNSDTSGPCDEYNCTNSEMGHLFYTELGNKGYYDTSGNFQPGYGLTKTGDFQHLSRFNYWSGTQSTVYTAWSFNASTGRQFDSWNGNDWAIAVHPGDVTVSGNPVAPEPISSILFITGGTLLAVRRYLRRKA